MITRNKMMALALTVQLSALPLMASAAFFNDTGNNWASSDISTLSDSGILTGYPDGSFRPNGLITRAEFAAMLVKALGLNTQAGGSMTFSDVPSGHWAYPAIETVRAQGLVGGYPNGTFGPARSITRAEAMAILSSAAHLPVPANAEQILSSYRDAGSIPTWARPAVAAAIQGGLFANDPNAGNAIEPLQAASRAEVAAMVQNLREMSNIAGGNNNNQTGYNNQTGSNTYGGMTQNGNTTTLQGRVATVPANTAFTGTITTPISSELNKVGDRVTLNVDQALSSSDGRVIVPAGSQIIGTVSKVVPSGRVGNPGDLDIDFNEIVTPNGERYTIQASVNTEDGMLHGDSTKGRILKGVGITALGAGLGAAVGAGLGPLAGGSVGKGAIYGTAIGAGAGAIAAGINKGKEVSMTSGDQLQIKLEQPIVVQVNN